MTIEWVREHYGNDVKVGAGNVVDAEGFRFLADAGADFVKIGIGGGSICITRETKGIGRGQATADHRSGRRPATSTSARPASTCPSAPTAASCTIITSRSRWPWAPTSSCWAATSPASTRALRPRSCVNGTYMKEYWGEGSRPRPQLAAATTWAASKSLSFEEGVDSYVPYAGSLQDNVAITLAEGEARTMCNCGALTIPELQEKAKLTLVSATSIVEGGAHDVLLKDKAPYASNTR